MSLRRTLSLAPGGRFGGLGKIQNIRKFSDMGGGDFMGVRRNQNAGRGVVAKEIYVNPSAGGVAAGKGSDDTKSPWQKVPDPSGKKGAHYYWNTVTNEVTPVGVSKPQHWVERPDPKHSGPGPAPTYWWNPETNETTPLGAPNPATNMYSSVESAVTAMQHQHTQVQVQQQGSPAPAPANSGGSGGGIFARGVGGGGGGSMMQYATLGFGTALAFIAVRLIIG